GGEHAAIHGQLVPGDESGIVARQEERGARHFLRGSEPPERKLLDTLGEGLDRFGRQARLPEDGRGDGAGPDRVDAYSPACELDGGAPRESSQGGLARRVDRG